LGTARIVTILTNRIDIILKSERIVKQSIEKIHYETRSSSNLKLSERSGDRIQTDLSLGNFRTQSLNLGALLVQLLMLKLKEKTLNSVTACIDCSDTVESVLEFVNPEPAFGNSARHTDKQVPTFHFPASNY
jgi:hypothetical protein